MTCIVGVEAEGKVVIGGDSWTSDDWSGAPLGSPKVFRSGEFAYGYAGSLRAGQVLEHIFVPPRLAPSPESSSIDRYMVASWATLLQNAMEGVSVESTDAADWQFLVGLRSRLYVVESDYTVWRCARGYHAIGTGSELALGALHALRAGCSGFTPRVLVQLAIASACEHANTVRGPITVVEVP